MDITMLSKFSQMVISPSKKVIAAKEQYEMFNKENRERVIYPRRSKSLTDLFRPVEKRYKTDEKKENGDHNQNQNQNKIEKTAENKEHVSCDYVPIHTPHKHYPVYPHSKRCCDSPDLKHLHNFTPLKKKESAFQLWQKRFRRQKQLNLKRKFINP